MSRFHVLSFPAVLVWMGGSLALCGLTGPASAAEDEFDPAGGAVAVAAGELASARGGATVLTATQTLNATATGNTVNVTGDFNTGSISVGDNFGSGVGSYVFNTGANTAINSALNVNVEIYPASPP